jgi:hypothetical protein
MAGGKITLPRVTIKTTVQGAYEVRRSGDRIGREDFIRTIRNNNTVIYESVFEVVEGDGTVVSGNNRLEVEEDSGFPRSYYTHRMTKGSNSETVREVTVEMYSNVAVVSERQGDKEGRRVITLPTGCLFVEGNTAGQLAVVLDRYDRKSGGRQSFHAFDPLGVGTTDVTLEAAGDSTLAGLGRIATAGPAAAPMEHFRYRPGKSPAVDFFVDGDGRVVWIDTGPSDLEYALVSYETRPGNTEPVK